MQSYIVLIRGINVGGKNKVPMQALRAALQDSGFQDVRTYIASGNVLLNSAESAAKIKQVVEAILADQFPTSDELAIQAHVITKDTLRQIIKAKPQGFGEQPQTYHSDVIFLIGLESEDVMHYFDPRAGVDNVWPGKGVVYSQRLSAERTKSRLGKIAASPAYKRMTIRSWNTTIKLLDISETEAAD